MSQNPSFPLGKKLNPKYDGRDYQFGEFLPGLKKAGLLPPLPDNFGHGNDFLGEDWRMLGNGPQSPGEPALPASWTAAANGAGDCFFAGMGHAIMAACRNAGKPIPLFTAESSLKEYSAYGGYNPITGDKDEGVEPRDSLKFVQKNGYHDAHGFRHDLGIFLSFEPKNLEELYYGMLLLEGVGVGIEFPGSAMNQFNEGKIWKVVPGSAIEGGHWIFAPGKPQKGYWALITWARRQIAAAPFYTKYNDESYGMIFPDGFKKTTGKDLEGHSMAQAEEYLHTIAKGL